jgi:hypothetical protein
MRSRARGRCEHDTFSVEVVPVGAGKKIAYCLGCGRSGPVGGGSAEALTALRETPWPAASLGPTSVARERVVGTEGSENGPRRMVREAHRLRSRPYEGVHRATTEKGKPLARRGRKATASGG